MKGLTITNPHGFLCAVNAKGNETRDWPTSYRGPLAIHTSKTYPLWAKQLVLYDDEFRRALRMAGVTPEACLNAPCGAILAVCVLRDCVRVSRDGSNIPSMPERAFGDYTPGRFMFRLAEVRLLEKPTPYRGALGLWDVPPALEMLLANGLAA